MTNRLGSATSPYLRQHAGNPVHWREWGDDALTEARDRDVPILLSVGYAACHWCHVMAHESFDDDATAEVMNANFVCIKVDREERPDIDAIYMAATVAMTGQGGWPMTCFLTPDGRPFYCGTYFPKTARGGMPSFVELLTAVADTWRNRRDEVEQVGGKVAGHLIAATAGLPEPKQTLSDEVVASAVAAVCGQFDSVSAGFGGAPKFPPSAMLEALLRRCAYRDDRQALEVAERTCEAMARGGIYDQLAGGFSRYSVDSAWVVPHFEKMLYDNALLLRAYSSLARITGNQLAHRVVDETIAFLRRDLMVVGGLASARDADADGVEGLTYVWTRAQLIEVLGDDDGTWVGKLCTVTEGGTFEHGSSTLQLPDDPDDAARWQRLRATLLAARDTRPQPEYDAKVIVSWNALAITALCESGRPDGVALAQELTDHLLGRHVVSGELRRTSLDGQVGTVDGALDDYAALVVALVTLDTHYPARGYRDHAFALLDKAIDLFGDPIEAESWFDAVASQALLTRPRDPLDGATPSGNSLMAEALMMASVVATGDAAQRYSELADATLARAVVVLESAPMAGGHWLAVTQAWSAGPVVVAVAQTPDSDGSFAADIRLTIPPGAIVVAAEPDSHPLLAQRPTVDNADTAYVCRRQTCSLPVQTVDDVRALVASQG